MSLDKVALAHLLVSALPHLAQNLCLQDLVIEVTSPHSVQAKMAIPNLSVPHTLDLFTASKCLSFIHNFLSVEWI